MYKKIKLRILLFNLNDSGKKLDLTVKESFNDNCPYISAIKVQNVISRWHIYKNFNSLLNQPKYSPIFDPCSLTCKDTSAVTEKDVK